MVILAMALLVTGGCSCQSALPGLEDGERDLTSRLPVFPGAEGFGTDTPAGRGGELIRVTRLDDEGPGTLRDALERAGPRVVVFEVSGTIDVSRHLVLSNPFITIAGQTAPIPGITISGAGLRVRTHDVLIQHLRIRLGTGSQNPTPENDDALELLAPDDGSGEVYGVVIDHCSLSFARDEVASTWNPGVRDATFSSNILAWGLDRAGHMDGRHSKGLLIGQSSRRIAVLRNLFAHNFDRNPVLVGDVTALVANNLVYDPGFFAIVHYGQTDCCPTRGTIQSNAVLWGPSAEREMGAFENTDQSHRDTRFFVADLLGGEAQSASNPEAFAIAQPPVTVRPLTLTPAATLESVLLPVVGARPRDRDAADLRVIADVTNREGSLIDSPADLGLPPDAPGSQQAFTEPPNPGSDDDGDGYTNLEEHLHTLAAALER